MSNIVVTGASAGIGAELARQLGQQGHQLVLGARRLEKLREVAASIEAPTECVPTDVTRRSDVEALRDVALERFGAIDVWGNNAGRGITQLTLDLTDEDLDEMWANNVKSVLYGVQAVVPHKKERGRGQIINVSSFLGRVPAVTARSAYSACKAAVNSLTANLRSDLRDSGIAVTLIIPGMVATSFQANARHAPPTQPAAPPGVPIQTAAEVAAVIARTIEDPVAEIYTNPAHEAVVAKYYEPITKG